MLNASKKYSDYYSNIANFHSDSLNIEIAILQKPVILPYINEEYSCKNLMELYANAEREYRTAEEWYTDVKANFYFPMLTPMVINGESTKMTHAAPDVSKFLAIGEFETTEYEEQNFISLIIPRHIVMGFRKEIPIGTKFTCNFIGGTTLYNSIIITGVSGIGTEYAMTEYKPLNWEECLSLSGGEGPEDEIMIEWLQNRVDERIEEYNIVFSEYEGEDLGEVNQRDYINKGGVYK